MVHASQQLATDVESVLPAGEGTVGVQIFADGQDVGEH